MTDWNYTPNDVTFNCLYGKTLSPITVIFDRLLLFQMSTNVPINRMTVTSMPTATIPLVPIDASVIPGTRETEKAAIFVSLTNNKTLATSVCYDTRISHSLFFFIIIWSLFWKLVLENTYFLNMSRSWIETKVEFVLTTGYIMTLYSLASVQMFSTLFRMVMPRGIYLTIKSFITWWLFPMFLMFGSAVIR